MHSPKLRQFAEALRKRRKVEALFSEQTQCQSASRVDSGASRFERPPDFRSSARWSPQAMPRSSARRLVLDFLPEQYCFPGPTNKSKLREVIPREECIVSRLHLHICDRILIYRPNRRASNIRIVRMRQLRDFVPPLTCGSSTLT